MSRACRHPRTSLAAFVLASLATGCSEELGPERFETTSVSGKVVATGGPITEGWVEFLPVEGTVGNLRTARIARDGSFQADKVPVGKVAIGLAHVPDRTIQTFAGGISARIFSFHSTPIRRTIIPAPTPPLVIDLDIEAARFAQGQAEIRKAREAESR